MCAEYTAMSFAAQSPALDVRSASSPFGEGNPPLQRRAQRVDLQTLCSSPLATDAFTSFVKAEVEKWAKVVAATGMTAEIGRAHV